MFKFIVMTGINASLKTRREVENSSNPSSRKIDVFFRVVLCRKIKTVFHWYKPIYEREMKSLVLATVAMTY